MNAENQLAIYYSRLPFKVVVEKIKEPDGSVYFVATHPELEGCIADGETEGEAIQNLADARTDYISALLSWGMPIPFPKGNVQEAEGRVKIIFQAPASASVDSGSRYADQKAYSVSGSYAEIIHLSVPSSPTYFLAYAG